MHNVTSAKFEPVVSRSAADEAIHDALRLFVGRGKRFTAKTLQRDSGVPSRMIESAVAPVGSTDFRPLSRENLFSIMAAIGSDFTNEVLPRLCGIGTFDIPTVACPVPAVLVAESAEDHAHIARAAANGEFCAKDHAELRRVGEEHIERGMQMVAMSAKPARKQVAA